MRQIQGRMGGKRRQAPGTPCGCPTRRKEPIDGDLGRHLTSMGCQSNPQRPTPASNDGEGRTGKTTARTSMRAMRSHQPDRPHRGASHPSTQRPGKIPRPKETTMGPTHGGPSPENVGPLSNLSPGHPIWTPTTTTDITLMNEAT
jgi:hypothetical protein